MEGKEEGFLSRGSGAYIWGWKWGFCLFLELYERMGVI